MCERMRKRDVTNACGENCSRRQYPTVSWRLPLRRAAPWEIEVLLALLGAEHCVRLSVVCFPCSLSSEAGRSDVCGVASSTEQEAQGQEPATGAEGCSLIPGGMRLF